MTALNTSAHGLDTARYDELLMRVGQLTRNLHESLRELGLDKEIERLAKDDVANTRDRLLYVARMTEQAAQRVLNATDAAVPLQERIEQEACALLADWQSLAASEFSESEFHESELHESELHEIELRNSATRGSTLPRALVQRTQTYLQQTGSAAAATRGHLLEIMMAQDFQDLTGQVITKVTQLGHSLESQLVQLLVEHAPLEGKHDAGQGLLNGPQVNPAGKADVVADQEQVDDLLDSLGF